MTRPGEILEQYLIDNRFAYVSVPQRRIKLGCMVGQLLRATLIVNERPAFTAHRIADCTESSVLSARALIRQLVAGGYVEELPHGNQHKNSTEIPRRLMTAAYWPYAPAVTELGVDFMAAAQQDAERTGWLQCTSSLLEREVMSENISVVTTANLE